MTTPMPERRLASPKEFLLGRMAVREGLITAEQLHDCVLYQKRSAPSTPLGRLMVARGLLTLEQVEGLLAGQREAARVIGEQELSRLRSATFGQIALRASLLDTDVLHRALREQALEEDAGRGRPLGEILVEWGALSREQADYVLGIQRRTIVLCTSCGSTYNVERMVPGRRFHCGKCRAELVVPQRTWLAGAVAASEDDAGIPDLESLEPLPITTAPEASPTPPATAEHP